MSNIFLCYVIIKPIASQKSNKKMKMNSKQKNTFQIEKSENEKHKNNIKREKKLWIDRRIGEKQQEETISNFVF